MSIDTTCLLVFVEIVSSSQFLKWWGLHQVSDTATLGKGHNSKWISLSVPLELQNNATVHDRVQLPQWIFPGLSSASYSQRGSGVARS